MTTKRPTHRLVAISGEGQSARFTEIAVLWPAKSGFTGEIPAGVSITGRFGIFAIGEKKGGAQ